MVFISMYTANLTAHLTLERSEQVIRDFKTLLNQKVYQWGIITERNLESLMVNHDDSVISEVLKRARRLRDLEEAMTMVRRTGFVFIDESSVLEFIFKEDCDATLVNTRLFDSQWSFGLQKHSSYKHVLDKQFLQYRESGWFNKLAEKWHGKGANNCLLTVGSENRFSLNVLSGLFFVLGVGAMSAVVLLACETLHAAHQDSLHNKELSFLSCLRVRVRLKRMEIANDWLGLDLQAASMVKLRKLVLNTLSDKSLRQEFETGI